MYIFYATYRELHSTMQPCVVVMLWTILWQRGHTSTTKIKMVYGNSFKHNLSVTLIFVWLEFQSLACSRLSKEWLSFSEVVCHQTLKTPAFLEGSHSCNKSVLVQNLLRCVMDTVLPSFLYILTIENTAALCCQERPSQGCWLPCETGSTSQQQRWRRCTI